MAARPNALAWLALSLLVLALDQLTKHIALVELRPYEPHAVIPGLLNWTLAFNPGAAFSFLAGESGWQRWLFAVLAIGVSTLLAVWLSRTPRADWRNALPLSLIIGGAVGNLVDRLRFGHVTDFVQVYWGDWSFPAFNVADSAISVGAVLLAVLGLFFGGKAAAKGG
ncbi:signal peptidase II [Dokdonella fugitiva]|uniref:Lipoprotein signal peptidase n=1 Tax=Dokdonella fugitiva TaxID=328517 RepID=A0A839EZB4_9GAMM|nr:signal peptidase II [Dokdonella fugitiva]MBA8888003.1 signal peptidase II [Dokdonella fugitiva]